MDCYKILSLLDQLDDEVDELEEALTPLLKTSLSDSASKLPLLDKAKLCVLTTYAIESILFSYLRLNGVKARDHPVFKELTRVKQYFDKIKVIENPPERNATIDKGAAARFIKAGLAGNKRYDLEIAERQAKERARAHLKSKSEDGSFQAGMKRKVQEEQPRAMSSGSSSSSEDDLGEQSAFPAKPNKKRKLEARTSPNHLSSASVSSDPGQLGQERTEESGKLAGKELRQQKRALRRAAPKPAGSRKLKKDKTVKKAKEGGE